MGYRNDDTALTVMDWFCGAGGSSQGVHAVPGVRVERAANHWKLAIESHATNFPTTSHYQGDIRKAPVWEWPVTDIFWASPECFPAGTMILARRGLVPIEDVAVGEEVFTHERRWRPVTATMRKVAETVYVKGVGYAGGIETTPEHPFYTRTRTKVWKGKGRGYRHELVGAPEWTEAKNLDGRLWATPIDFGQALPVPEIGGRGDVDLTPEFWWLVGRWLGDGSLRLKERPSGEKSRYEMVVSCGHHEADSLAASLARVAGLRWARRDIRTATNFTTGHRGLVEWLDEHFGQHAAGKTIPAWALTLPEVSRRALLDGYVSADGCTNGVYQRMTTVSKGLAVGLRMLANTVGHVANLSGPYTRKGERVIEGRRVTERPFWSLNWITEGPKHAFHNDEAGYRWAPVKSVEVTGRQVEVFNLSVADDESYVADGITVHNCTNWSVAKGKKRDFVGAMQGSLLDLLAAVDEDDEPSAEEESRALMEEVPLYLRGVQERGGLVKAGIVENVTDVRAWDQWDRWIGEIHKLGYRTRIIALNSMHANPRSVHAAPQSRDRLYVGYWHESLGRTPDWDKWLRPRAWCSGCDAYVQAMQVFKDPKRDMGRYRQQYVYRCPNTSCRNQVVEPEALPAAAAIDWSIPGQRIGDRAKPLADKTLARIEAGLKKFARPVPMMVPAGGTWRDAAVSVGEPMPARTTRENDALMVPPLMVPVEGRDGKSAASAHSPLRAMTTRNETGLAWLPFIAELRGGGSVARTVAESLATVTASGNHHGLVTPPMPAMVMRNNGSKGDGGEHCTSPAEPFRTMTTAGHQSLLTWEHMLVPYYGNGAPRSVNEPIGALTTRDRYALVRGEVDINDVMFRMLEPHEIGRAMSFADSYVVLGNKREKVRQYGNAVTPNAAEVLVCALVEAITGEEIDRYADEPFAVAA